MDHVTIWSNSKWSAKIPAGVGRCVSGQMSGIFYRECEAQAVVTENDAMTRLRSDQMLRAVRMAAGFGPRPRGARSGQVLDDESRAAMVRALPTRSIPVREGAAPHRACATRLRRRCR